MAEGAAEARLARAEEAGRKLEGGHSHHGLLLPCAWIFPQPWKCGSVEVCLHVTNC